MKIVPERNAPCPCGSGKKFKKCCGAPAPDRNVAAVRSRASAYDGDFGRAREAFCLEYIDYKKAQLESISEGLRRAVGEEGKAISCAKGCTHCCHVYVVATLQECEAIVYYLYRHEDILNNFLKNYEKWNEAIHRISDIFRDIGRLRSKQIMKLDTEADRAAFDAALMAYAEKDIPCPFLDGGACSIYEVRPYVCAGVVSTTPPDWCYHGNSNNPQAALIRREMLLSNDKPYFASPFGKVILSSLPALVHGILLRGQDFIYGVLGFKTA